ncbi:Hypothetical protein SRAE_1000105800 [Strongyloides ratti]|uniref:Uncharacterized protein n=1 Tax=Strongyloides ratti TaxID=34506 RepID=A0A090L5N5_STRRB|nr:Hypothetical protein SRAE_1000105800 [Strongyloides ratti]CEF62789.1 Hypothetical protein SRAE_1000105800 [Strongyloides ratti]
MLPNLINEKIRHIFEIPEEINIPNDVTTKISNKLLQMFVKNSEKNTTNSIVISLDEENIPSNSKTSNYLKNILKEKLLCDDEDNNLSNYQQYTNTNNTNDASEKLRKIFEEKTYTDDEIYAISSDIQSDMN